MNLTAADIEILLDALNDRESVLCADWEAANKANSTALMMSLCSQLREVRNLANKIAAELVE